jgi:cysteinyl-tRNA synthetase
MDDDFNTSAALAALFQFIRRLNILMDKIGLSISGKEKVIKALESIDSVLGVMALEPEDMDREAENLIAQRERARKEKDWDTADALRQKLKEMGIEVIDTKEGTGWRRTRDK